MKRLEIKSCELISDVLTDTGINYHYVLKQCWGPNRLRMYNNYDILKILLRKHFILSWFGFSIASLICYHPAILLE